MDCLGNGVVVVLILWVRYQVMRRGRRRGPRVKRRVLRLEGVSVCGFLKGEERRGYVR